MSTDLHGFWYAALQVSTNHFVNLLHCVSCDGDAIDRALDLRFTGRGSSPSWAPMCCGLGLVIRVVR